jgi:hypothetical protein
MRSRPIGSDKPKSSEIRDKAEYEFLPARQNTERAVRQINLNEIKVPLSQKGGDQDAKDGSIDKMK